MRMRRAAAAATAAGALSFALASCGLSLPTTSHPTGRAGLDALVRTIPEADGAPGYYDYNGGNWTGEGPVYADIPLETVSPARLKVIVDELGAFLAADAGGAVSWDEIHVDQGRWTLAVRDHRVENDEMRAVYATLSADPKLEGGRIARYASVITTAGDFVPEYKLLDKALLATHYIGSHGIETDSDDSDVDYEFYGQIGDITTAEARAYQELASAYTVVGATVTYGEVEVTVDQRQLKAATRDAAQMSDSTGITINVTGGDASGSSS